MGHDAVEINKENIEVTIPIYRTDIMHAMDIVEDVAIAFGYENFEAVIPNISTIGEENPLEVFTIYFNIAFLLKILKPEFTSSIFSPATN